MAEQQLPNGLLRLIEAGIDLALYSDNTHQGEHWDGNDDGNEVEKRVAQLLNDDEINTEDKDAFRQQTVIGWEYIYLWVNLHGDGENAGPSDSNGLRNLQF